MKSGLMITVVGALLLAACGLPGGLLNAPLLTAEAMPTFTPTPRLTFNPAPTFAVRLPTAVYTQAAFPSCEPDPVPPYQPGAEAVVTILRDSNTPSLRGLAEQRGLWIGAAIDPGNLDRPDFRELLASEFNLVTPEVAMKWEVIHPEPGRYNFARGDAIVAFAQANGMAVRGHTLVWHSQLPPWILEGNYNRQEWIGILCRHIKTVVGHYRGQLLAWDVVNEALDNQGLYYDSPWLRVIGPEYIAMAFQWAHEADPDVQLFYNDFAAEALNSKSQAMYALVQGLQRSGIPIHGVGLQMHIFLGGQPTPQDLAANLQRYADLGLLVDITEMDVRTQFSRESQVIKEARLAERYRQVFAACLGAPNCRAFVTWGLTDRYSWIPGYTGKPDAPLLFDKDFRPKAAYYAILELLQGP